MRITQQFQNKARLFAARAVLFLMVSGATQKGMAQSSSLGLKESIKLAMANNGSLRADSFGISEAAYKNREVAGSYLPQVNYSTQAEYNLAIPSQMLPGSVAGEPSKDLVPVRFGTRYNFRSGAEVNQAIFRKDLSVKIKAADLYTGIATTKYQLSKEELVYQVAATFYSLQATYEKVQTTMADYRNIKEVLDIAQAQYQNGTLKKIDYQTLQINLANKQSQLDQLQTKYNEQLSYFNFLIGLPADNRTGLLGDYTQVANLELPTAAISGRSDIGLYDQMIQSKMVDMKSIEAERLPSISSYFRFNVYSQFNKTSSAFDGDYTFKGSTVGLSVNIPVFDGNRRRSRLKTTQVQLNQLKLESRQLNDQAIMEFTSASEVFRNHKHQLAITKENLELAQQVFNSRKALYKEGVTTLIELLDTERELSEARANNTQAMIDVQKAWLDVHKANGTLLTNYLNSI